MVEHLMQMANALDECPRQVHDEALEGGDHEYVCFSDKSLRMIANDLRTIAGRMEDFIEETKSLMREASHATTG